MLHWSRTPKIVHFKSGPHNLFAYWTTRVVAPVWPLRFCWCVNGRDLFSTSCQRAKNCCRLSLEWKLYLFSHQGFEDSWSRYPARFLLTTRWRQNWLTSSSPLTTSSSPSTTSSSTVNNVVVTVDNDALLVFFRVGYVGYLAFEFVNSLGRVVLEMPGVPNVVGSMPSDTYFDDQNQGNFSLNLWQRVVAQW